MPIPKAVTADRGAARLDQPPSLQDVTNRRKMFVVVFIASDVQQD